VALFPYKKLDYAKKYFRSFLLTLGTINALYAVCTCVIIIMTLTGVYPPDADKTPPKDIVTKEQVVNTFNNEISNLRDSVNFYLEMALAELAKGTEKEEIRKMVKPKISFFHNEANSKLQSFSVVASEVGLTK